MLANQLTYVIASMLVLIGCQKEEPDSKQFQNNRTSDSIYSLPSLPNSLINYGSISIYSGRLRFDTYADVSATMQELERQYLEYDSAFTTLYNDLTLDSMNIVEDLSGFNSERTYEVFENTLSFNSLRKILYDQETEWLEDDSLDINSDPDNHPVVEEEFRSILNCNAELIVSDSVYRFYDSFYLIIFKVNLDSSLQVADDINNGLIDVYTISPPQQLALGIRFFWGSFSAPPGATCAPRSNQKSKGFDYNGNQRIKWILKISNAPWNANISKAVIKAYKRKIMGGNGKGSNFSSEIMEIVGTLIWPGILIVV